MGNSSKVEKYETVIVGAGPAGLQCARILAESGKKVLVLERKEVIGSKICAGGLTAKDLTLGIPENLGISFRRITMHTPYNSDVIESEKPIITTVDREVLGQWMTKEAKNAGAIIKANTNVTEIRKNSIIANDKEIKFRYLVGADGSASLVRKSLGLKTEEMLVAIQYITEKEFRNLEFFLDAKLFGSGYAWIFPHKGYTSIGCGCDPKFLSANDLRKNFHKWLKYMKIDVSNAKFEGAPINYDYRGYRFKNKFLIGDAAGFASGLTGEGMYFAMVSGQEVAKLIIDKNRHEPEGIERILRVKRSHEEALKLIEFSGPLKAVIYESLGMLLKSKFVDKELGII
jgi:geranylgeranyl reductase